MNMSGLHGKPAFYKKSFLQPLCICYFDLPESSHTDCIRFWSVSNAISWIRRIPNGSVWTLYSEENNLMIAQSYRKVHQ